jgi:predicted CopG family antitoxin
VWKIILLKTLKVSDEIHKELSKIGMWGESMDDIVRKLVDYYKKGHSNK